MGYYKEQVENNYKEKFDNAIKFLHPLNIEFKLLIFFIIPSDFLI